MLTDGGGGGENRGALLRLSTAPIDENKKRTEDLNREGLTSRRLMRIVGYYRGESHASHAGERQGFDR